MHYWTLFQTPDEKAFMLTSGTPNQMPAAEISLKINQDQEVMPPDTSEILHNATIEGCKSLDDGDINKVMGLIKIQFPHLTGLHDCLIGHSHQSFPKTEGVFLQILHVNGNHWITVQHIPQLHIVKVYDSIYESTSEDAKWQIAALLRTKDKQIELKIQKVQYHNGNPDCGIFAVAFATDLAYGCNPTRRRYNPIHMRSHYLQCISTAQKVTQFPSTVKKPEAPNTEYIEVFCTCRLPANESMIQCYECKEMYHKSCIDITPPDTLHWKWKCSTCTVTCNSERRITMEGNQCKFFSQYFKSYYLQVWRI